MLPIIPRVYPLFVLLPPHSPPLSCRGCEKDEQVRTLYTHTHTQSSHKFALQNARIYITIASLQGCWQRWRTILQMDLDTPPDDYISFEAFVSGSDARPRSAVDLPPVEHEVPRRKVGALGVGRKEGAWFVGGSSEWRRRMSAPFAILKGAFWGHEWQVLIQKQLCTSGAARAPDPIAMYWYNMVDIKWLFAHRMRMEFINKVPDGICGRGGGGVNRLLWSNERVYFLCWHNKDACLNAFSVVNVGAKIPCTFIIIPELGLRIANISIKDERVLNVMLKNYISRMIARCWIRIIF